MDPSGAIDDLAAFAGARAGSEAERQAALGLAERLRAAGREVEVEPLRFHHRWALAQATAAALAVLGSVVSVGRPAAGAALVFVAFASSTLEALGATAVLARLFGVRASQNVSSPPATRTERGRGLAVLAAAYDAPRRSAFARLTARLGDPAPWIAATYLALLLCCLARLAGIEGDWLTAIQLVPTLALLALVPALVDVELAPTADGRAEAAGVACALALAERLDGELDRLDVWVVLAGAGAANGAGMRAWRRRHRRELADAPAVTIEVGAPDPDTVEETVEALAALARRLDLAAPGGG